MIKVAPYEITFESIYGCSPDEATIPEGWELTGKILPTGCATEDTVLLSTASTTMTVCVPGYYRAELKRKQLTFKDLPPGPFIATWRTNKEVYIKLNKDAKDGPFPINAVTHEGSLTFIDYSKPVEKYKNSDGVRP